MGKPKTELEKLESTLTEVREAIQEMHGLLRDVRQTKRDVQDMIRKSRLDWDKEAMDYVHKELDELGLDLRKHIESQRDEIKKSFDKLSEAMNRGPDWAKGKTIGQIIREAADRVEREAMVLKKLEGG